MFLENEYGLQKQDQKFISYHGVFEIQEELNGLKFNISPKSFFQTNPVQAEKLYQVALDFAEITKNDVVYDLYCGTGTITCLAAKKAKKAIGVEIVDEAIEAANVNASDKTSNNDKIFFILIFLLYFMILFTNYIPINRR